MNYKILVSAFKNEFGKDWQTELRDFEHGNSGWFDAVMKIELTAATNDRTADINKIIESVREWMGKHGVQSKVNNPEQFMHMAPHTWIFLEQILKKNLSRVDA